MGYKYITVPSFLRGTEGRCAGIFDVGGAFTGVFGAAGRSLNALVIYYQDISNVLLTLHLGPNQSGRRGCRSTSDEFP